MLRLEETPKRRLNLLFCRELQRTCIAIVLLIKPLVQSRSRCRCRRVFVRSLITSNADANFLNLHIDKARKTYDLNNLI